MRRLVAATGNPHKAEEIAAILEAIGFEVVLPTALPEVIEDGDTFEANARKKARACAAHLDAWAIADDSGLSVACLDGAPGVYSARYAGEAADDEANNAKLIATLEARGERDPAAAFVSHVVVARPDGSLVAEARGTVEGVIRWPAEGEGGFGYDPLFFHPPSGCRFSQLAPEAKNAVSHRGDALRRLARALREVPNRE